MTSQRFLRHLVLPLLMLCTLVLVPSLTARAHPATGPGPVESVTLLTPTTIAVTDPTQPEIPNPGRGLYRWRNQDMMCQLLPGTATYKDASMQDAYERWTWRELEPIAGAYDFSGITATLTAYPTQRLWIGLGMSSGPIDQWTAAYLPDYLMTPTYATKFGSTAHGETTEAKRVWYLNYNNPLVQARMDALLTDFVRQFKGNPRIAGVQMRTYGRYGELYMPYDVPVDLAPSILANESTTRWMVDTWHRIVRVGGGFEVQLPLSNQILPQSGAPFNMLHYAMTKEPKWGWFRDALGHTAQMDNINQAISANVSVDVDGTPTATGSLIAERWKYKPIFTEMIGGYLNKDDHPAEQAAQFALARDQVTQYNVSLVGNGNFADPYDDSPWYFWQNYCYPQTTPWTDQQTADFILAGKKAGYRYAINRVAVANAVPGQLMTLTTNWTNHGSAPIYQSWPVVFQLRSGSTAVWQGVSQGDLRTILPGAAVSVQDSFTLPGSVPAGTYQLHVILPAVAPYPNPLNLALTNRQTDGSYALGAVTITPPPPAVRFEASDYEVRVSSQIAKTVRVTVRLNGVASQPTTVQYATRNGTATAGVHYTAKSGTLTIPTGQSSAYVDVTIPKAATTFSPWYRTFYVDLANPLNAGLIDPRTTTVHLTYCTATAPCPQ